MKSIHILAITVILAGALPVSATKQPMSISCESTLDNNYMVTENFSSSSLFERKRTVSETTFEEYAFVMQL